MSDDKLKVIKIIGSISFYTGLAASIYALADVIVSYIGLPEGACPFIRSRPFMYAGAALLFVSLVLSFFEPRNKKEENAGSDQS